MPRTSTADQAEHLEGDDAVDVPSAGVAGQLQPLPDPLDLVGRGQPPAEPA